jgi:CHASE1-domain containing sensor protein
LGDFQREALEIGLSVPIPRPPTALLRDFQKQISKADLRPIPFALSRRDGVRAPLSKQKPLRNVNSYQLGINNANQG